MNKIVCIDSNIYIWGVKKEGDSNRIPLAVKFIAELEEKKTKILLPEPVIIELLSHLKDEIQKNQILDLINNRNIIVKPLDRMASIKCGEILYKTFSEPEIVKYTKDNKIDRAKIKYDALITAIAIVNKCDCIYTNNTKDFIRYSHGLIKLMRCLNIYYNKICSAIQVGYN